MKHTRYILAALLTAISLTSTANENFFAEANLSQVQIKEFSTLSVAVQKMIINDHLRAKKLKALAAKKHKKAQLNFLSFGQTKVPKAMDHCDDEDEDTGDGYHQCVPNCTWRSSDGSCKSYGSDYCGEGASCAMNCTWRRSDGSCNSYDADFCGSYATCSENCTWRSSDGSCNSYGPDICY